MEKTSMITTAVDLTKTLFENDFEAILYITYDIYGSRYIISLPVLAYSGVVWTAKDIDYWLEGLNISDERKQGLKDVILTNMNG